MKQICAFLVAGRSALHVQQFVPGEIIPICVCSKITTAFKIPTALLCHTNTYLSLLQAFLLLFLLLFHKTHDRACDNFLISSYIAKTGKNLSISAKIWKDPLIK